MFSGSSQADFTGAVILPHRQCTGLRPRLTVGNLSLCFLDGVQWAVTALVIYVPLVTRDAEHLFGCLLAIRVPSVEKCLFHAFATLNLVVEF